MRQNSNPRKRLSNLNKKRKLRLKSNKKKFLKKKLMKVFLKNLLQNNSTKFLKRLLKLILSIQAIQSVLPISFKLLSKKLLKRRSLKRKKPQSLNYLQSFHGWINLHFLNLVSEQIYKMTMVLDTLVLSSQALKNNQQKFSSILVLIIWQ